MNRVPIYSLLLLSGITLFSCEGADSKSRQCPAALSIIITMTGANQCKANPDPAPVKDGCQVVWPNGTDYTIDFKGYSPVGGSVSDSSPHTVNASYWCKHWPHTSCDYPYKITQGSNPPCADPIIHIVPNQ